MAEGAPRKIGRYEVLGQIAEGGMGSVLVGRATGAAGFERTVALKTLHPHLAKNRDYVEMFLDEARLAATIRDPHVVGVHDIIEGDDELCLVMDLIEGASLSALTRRAASLDQRLPIPVVCRILSDVLLGLNAAHEAKRPSGEALLIVHRDVSPQNILVGRDGVSRITDFGVAKALVRLAVTRGGMMKGKLRYSAPEQLRGTDVDRRLDIFAAGIVLWESLTGRALFGGEAESEVVTNILFKTIDPPSRYRDDIPPELDQACLHALERDMESRFATAHDFSRAVAQACPLADPSEVGRWVDRLHEAEIDRINSMSRSARTTPFSQPLPLLRALPGDATETLHIDTPMPEGTIMTSAGAPFVQPPRKRSFGTFALALGGATLLLFAGYKLGGAGSSAPLTMERLPQLAAPVVVPSAVASTSAASAASTEPTAKVYPRGRPRPKPGTKTPKPGEPYIPPDL